MAPNILLLLFDQLSAAALRPYGNPVAQAPTLDALAEGGTLFEQAYCASPLCAPSRYAMLSARHCSRIGAYDNAAEMPAALPTIAHHLRALGYRTALAGKMHFAGPDQLHGFEERLTTDIYPSDFGWAPDWTQPSERPFWYHDMLSVVEAGPYARTLQLDFDEEVAHRARRWLFDRARERDPERRPFFLTVSFTQPHDPYMCLPGDWGRYRPEEIDLPAPGPLPEEALDPHSRRLLRVIDAGRYRVEEAHVRNARRAYYAMISWLDARCAELLAVLAAGGLESDTLVVASADHGDMLGERGLWYKMCFFERAMRVPLLARGPGIRPGGRCPTPVSMLDLLPTLLEVAAGRAGLTGLDGIEGRSLAAALAGATALPERPVLAEYLGEGAVAPMLMVRHGRHKLIECPADPALLYDLEADPGELVNLAAEPAAAAPLEALRAIAGEHWDVAAVHEAVLSSQRERRLVHGALLRGRITPWDHQPREAAAAQYNRNYAGELYDTDRRARIPYRAPPPLAAGREPRR